jgi:putative Mn2+ efflux pump MntP
VFALILAAFAVGLGNFAASIGIGLSGADTATRIKVGLVFGLFESGMPLVGLLAGQKIANELGSISRYAGGALLVATGVWALVQTVRGEDDEAPVRAAKNGRLLITALALSMDNLVVGFGLGAQRVSLLDAIGVFAVVSIGLSLLGLEFGRRLGSAIERGSEYLSGAVLVIVGILVATGSL